MPVTHSSSVVVEEVGVSGADRTLGGRFGYPANGQPTWSCLILGPHPLLGGDLDNNLVTALLFGLAEAGCGALSFNYSGVGASEGGPEDWPAVMSEFWEKGCFDEEGDWVVDGVSALHTIHRLCDERLLVVGYSFGCWAASEILSHSAARAAVFISPNPKRHDFASLSDFRAPLLVVHSDNDFTCTVDEMADWFNGLRNPKALCMLPSGEHFFRGQEAGVVKAVLRFASRQGIGMSPAP